MMKPSSRPSKPSKAPRCGQNDVTEVNQPAPVGVVGIGASAGGLAALETFFANLPATTGLAFVVVTHLDPAHESLLPELLQKHSSIPLQLAQEAMQIKPDTAYFIPPNRDLALRAGQLHLLPPARVKRLRHPIDSFLQSLAAEQGDRAICVILSGTGTDGSLGLKTIKQQGGLVMVQDETSAQYQGMPKSAIETGLVDLVLPAEDIPGKIVEYVRFAEDVRQSGQNTANMPELAKQLPRIFNLIRNQFRLDLNDYQPEPVMRSIERRMLLVGMTTPAAYVEFLLKTPSEVTSLRKDLLTCVTLFFREPRACQVLKNRVIPELLKNRSAEQPVRIWVAGCCTGEEAYSLAMLLHEQKATLKHQLRVQIFATDSDEKALEVARNGLYSTNNVANLSAKRLKTYFSKVDDRYKICKELRDWFIFAPHNLLHDPPFAKLDLIYCGPLLSHLKPLPQKNILERFCYGLNQGGFLAFGTTETATETDGLLTRLDKKWRRVEPDSSIFALTTDVRPSPAQHFTPDLEVFAAPSTDTIAPGRYAADRLLQSYSPPCVVVNSDYEVVHFSTRTSRYLQPPIGMPNLNLLNIAREDLRAELRIALHKTFSSGEKCHRQYRKIEQNGSVETINISIEPFPTSAPHEQLALVVLDGSSEPALTLSSQETPATTGQATVKDLRIKQLENELQQIKEELRLTAEETDTLKEEFKSSHEELLSINEELHSSNEELETSKEELQALNEELTSVNSEYKLKLAELEAANSDLSNLFNSTRIATLFLDRQLQIRLFTPALVEIYQLQKSDIGRPLQQFACR
ncbi:MAG TPA: chemotaxis protein CheB, partial [Malonomonas sp.]